jgi:hypothetical protein
MFPYLNEAVFFHVFLCPTLWEPPLQLILYLALPLPFLREKQCLQQVFDATDQIIFAMECPGTVGG